MLQARDPHPTPEAGRQKLGSEKDGSYPCASVTALQVKNAPVEKLTPKSSKADYQPVSRQPRGQGDGTLTLKRDHLEGWTY